MSLFKTTNIDPDWSGALQQLCYFDTLTLNLLVVRVGDVLFLRKASGVLKDGNNAVVRRYTYAKTVSIHNKAKSLSGQLTL